MCLPISKLNRKLDEMRRVGDILRRELVHISGTGMLLKTLLISSLLGWATCQESQSMTPEEKTVIR